MVLELCPTSNLHTQAVEGMDEFKHIVQTFWDRGVKVTINTDGPYLLETDMRTEVELVEKQRHPHPEQVDQTLAWARSTPSSLKRGTRGKRVRAAHARSLPPLARSGRTCWAWPRCALLGRVPALPRCAIRGRDGPGPVGDQLRA